MDEQTTRVVISLSNIIVVTELVEERMAQVDKTKLEAIEWDFLTAMWFLIRRELKTILTDLENE